MTHQKAHTVNGIMVPWSSTERLDARGNRPCLAKDRFKKPPSQEAALPRLHREQSCLQHAHHIHVSLMAFKKITAGILYMVRKEPHVFGFTLTVQGTMDFSYESIWKECLQDLCHCAVFTVCRTGSHHEDEDASQPCRCLFLPFLTLKQGLSPCWWQAFTPVSPALINTGSGVPLDVFDVFIFWGRKVMEEENTS